VTVATARKDRPTHRCAECGVTVAKWVGQCPQCQAWGIPVPPDVAMIGEVALSGDLRPVGQLPQRVAEAARLGYTKILVPPGARKRLTSTPAGAVVVELEHLGRALEALAAYGPAGGRG